MFSTWVHRTLKTIFSASCIGTMGFLAAALCVAAAIAFSSIWASAIELKPKLDGGGQFSSYTIKFLLSYSAVVFAACSAVTLDLFQARRIIARFLGQHWKLTSVLIGTALVSSVLYFFMSFAAFHLEPGEIVSGRPSFRHASFFWYDLIIPRPKFTREDGLTALFLFMSGCISFAMFFFLSLRSEHHLRSTLPGELWGVFCAGFVWLAADEFFEVNRCISANAANLGLLNLREGFSYIVLLGYAIIALTILLAYVPELWHNRLGFVSLTIGVIFQASALGVDLLFHAWRKEEAFEIAEAAMFFIAVVYYAYDELDSYIQHQKMWKNVV